MNAACAVALFLPEAADLNLGALGVEIEMLLRADIRDKHTRLAKEFNELLYATQFVLGSDTSISKTAYTKDAYYTNFETANATKTEWSLLAPRLLRLLAWLKRSDRVGITRSAPLTHDLVRAPEVNGGDPANWKEAWLPRAKLPNNASAAVHLHFDIHDWFGSEEHAVEFIRQFNKVGPEKFKPAIFPPRYSRPGQRGNSHAKFDPLDPAFLRSNPAKIPGFPLDRKIKDTFYATAMGDRKRALNCLAALKRGDVEFRFLHSTLSFNTIAGWFQALAELIEYSRLNSAGFKPGSFDKYLAGEAPETEKFLQDRTRAAGRAATEEPSLSYPYRQGRAVTRLARRLAVDPRRGFPVT